MPTLKESLVNLNELPKGYTPSLETSPPVSIASNDSLDQEPIRSIFQRTTLPPISSSPDSLRSFYLGAKIPQRRTLPPQSSTSGSGNTINTSTIITSSGGSGGGKDIDFNPIESSTGLVTPVLVIGQKYTSTLQMSKSFLLIGCSVSSAARIELYSTKNAQTLDLSRNAQFLPPFGSSQGLISDLVLVSPLTWQYINTTGSNLDTPQSNTVYVTVTNFGIGSAAITISVQYVPSEI